MAEPTIPLIVWSGGVDSTSILVSALEDICEADVVYFNLANNSKKSKREIKAINKIIKILKKDHLKSVNLTIVDIPAIFPKQQVCLPQPFIWITELIKVLDYKRHYAVLFGYIVTDTFWHIRPEFETAYTSLFSIYWGDVHRPELRYNMEYHTKSESIEYLRSTYPKIFKHTVYCESNNTSNKPCGRCSPCKSHKYALELLKS